MFNKYNINTNTPRKRKLYQRIWRKESALCKLRKKYRSKKLKDLCYVDSDPLTQEISNSLSAEAVRLLAVIISNSKHKPRERRWNFEEKILALSLFKHSPKSYILLQTFSLLFHQDAPCNPSSMPFLLRLASTPMFLMHFITVCRKCLKKTGTVVCLMKCQSERMCGLIRNLTALRDLRILEVRTGCATFQITLYFSWSVVCIGSGSSRWLSTSVVEVLRLRCLCNS